MSLLIRIPALLVALGLLVSGGQAKMCEMVAFVGIDLHTPSAHCAHGGVEHTHSESEPCTDACFVELSEGFASVQNNIPTLIATEGFDSSLLGASAFLPESGLYARVSLAWHGPPQVPLRSLHSDPLFSGRFLV